MDKPNATITRIANCPGYQIRTGNLTNSKLTHSSRVLSGLNQDRSINVLRQEPVSFVSSIQTLHCKLKLTMMMMFIIIKVMNNCDYSISVLLKFE